MISSADHQPTLQWRKNIYKKWATRHSWPQVFLFHLTPFISVRLKFIFLSVAQWVCIHCEKIVWFTWRSYYVHRIVKHSRIYCSRQIVVAKRLTIFLYEPCTWLVNFIGPNLLESSQKYRKKIIQMASVYGSVLHHYSYEWLMILTCACLRSDSGSIGTPTDFHTIDW